jgi:tRNA nucleotidyltransferase (CCA-adding enzyme)
MKDLKSRIPPKTLALLRRIGRLAEGRGEAAYAVGGFVRDLILGRPGMDIDITVEGDGLAFAEKLAESTGSQVEAFTRFGTSIVVVPGFGKLDVATARTESYERPGALPSVRKGGILQDLYRRDFTLNAMALTLSPGYFLRLLDPFGGLADLKRGRIRALHDRSFMDDPTRIFRAVRFEQRFGKGIEPKTRRWLLASVRGDFLRKVSGERIRSELRLIFQEPRPGKAVLRLGQWGVLPHIHPGLGVTRASRRALPHIQGTLEFFRQNGTVLEEERMVWFQALLAGPDEARARDLSKRLMLSRVERKIVEQSAKVFPAVYGRMGKHDIRLSLIHGLLSPLRPEVQCFLTAAAPPALRSGMLKYFRRIRSSVPWVRGRDLQAAGIPPGFRYSFILLEALNGQLDGKFKNRREALKWVRKSFSPEG